MGGELKGLELSVKITHTGCFTYIFENINSTGNLALYNIKENKVSNKKDNFRMFFETVIIMLKPDSPIGRDGGEDHPTVVAIRALLFGNCGSP